MRFRIKIQNRKKSEDSAYGLDGKGVEWEDTACVWASIEWAKGKTALNVGALDAYAVVMVRMRWTQFINMRSRIVLDGYVYQILPDTFHADKQANTIQFNAQLIINDK